MLAIVEIRKNAASAGSADDRVVLDFDARRARRAVLTTRGGRKLHLDLARPTLLADGDGLVLADGSLVMVESAPEPLAEITAKDAATLARLAWHLGNRHTPTEIAKDRLRIRRDHVLEHLMIHLGASVAAIHAPFNPEGGAYGPAALHSHDHDAAHGHAHD